MSTKLKQRFWFVTVCFLSACSGQINFKVKKEGTPGVVDLCQAFGTGLQGGNCSGGGSRVIQLSNSVYSNFQNEIYPKLYASCKDCHQQGKLKADAPFVDDNKVIAFNAAFSRLKAIEDKITADHQKGSWATDLKDYPSNKQIFLNDLKDYRIQEVCATVQADLLSGESLPPRYCSTVELRTDLATINSISTNFSYVRFPITQIVYPGSSAQGKAPVFIEVGMREFGGLVAFGEIRAYNTNDNFRLSEVQIEHNVPGGGRISRAFPENPLAVPKATVALPAPPATLPGASLTSLVSAPINASSVTAQTPLTIALKFSAIDLGLAPPAPLTARQKFDNNVVGVLQPKCMSCHQAGGSGAGAYLMFPADPVTRYDSAKARITPRNFAASVLVTKGTGTQHGGGNAFQFGSQPRGPTDQAIVLDWINSEQ